MRRDLNKDEIVKEIISGTSQKDVSIKYKYAQSSISGLMKKTKAMIDDFASNHSLEDTIEKYADCGITEAWLNENGIVCTPPKISVNENALLRNYRTGASLEDCAEIYEISVDEVREIVANANIPIREDEDRPVGEGFITTEDYATDVEYKKPNIHTYDVVWVANAKYGDARDEIESRLGKYRPAIILSPQWFIDSQTDMKWARVQVIYGTTKVFADNHYAIVINKYYTGKESEYQLGNLDTIKMRDIQIKEKYPHLSVQDQERLKDKISSFFIGEDRIKEVVENEPETVDVTDSVIDLFQRGLNRPEIYDFFKTTEYDVSNAEIQSILQKAGYGSMKRFTIDETAQEEVVETHDTDKDTQIEILKAKLSVYESIFANKTVSINV